MRVPVKKRGKPGRLCYNVSHRMVRLMQEICAAARSRATS